MKNSSQTPTVYVTTKEKLRFGGVGLLVSTLTAGRNSVEHVSVCARAEWCMLAGLCPHSWRSVFQGVSGSGRLHFLPVSSWGVEGWGKAQPLLRKQRVQEQGLLWMLSFLLSLTCARDHDA